MRTRAAFQRATILSYLLALLSALPASAAELNSVKLRVGGKEAPKTSALYDGREVYVSPDTLKLFGAGYRLTRRQDAAEIFPPDSRSFELGLARLKGAPMIPLAALAAKLDAEVALTDGLCDVRARIRAIDFGEDAVRVTTTFPVELSARVKHGAKSWVTIAVRGASAPIGHDTLKASWGDAGVTSSKFEQTEEGVLIRLEMERGITALPGEFDAARDHVVLLERSAKALATKNPGKPNLKSARRDSGEVTGAPAARSTVRSAPETPKSTSKSEIDLNPRRDRNPKTSVVGLPHPLQDPGNIDTFEPPTGVGDPAPAALRVTGVSLKGVSPNSATLRISTNGKIEPVMQLIPDPERLVIDLPSCALPEEITEWPSAHGLVSGILAAESEAPGVSRLVVALNRVVGYRITQSGPDGITISLVVPRVGTGRSMRDIVIVVDPGHGGDANGCTVKAGGKLYNEKTITLSISRKLRALLEEAGANVIMTRNSDNSVGLYDRSGLANDNNANLFVSVHVDFVSYSGPRGSTVYHHMYSSAGKEFAKAVMGRISEASGIPARGAVSDRKLYPNGLAVLRTSTMPAILVETGFLSNAADRQKLIDERWHQVMAEAIFSGIRDYVEGPQSENTTTK